MFRLYIFYFLKHNLQNYIYTEITKIKRPDWISYFQRVNLKIFERLFFIKSVRIEPRVVERKNRFIFENKITITITIIQLLLLFLFVIYFNHIKT